MKYYEYLKTMMFMCVHYYQRIQNLVLSLFIIGIVDYFLLYEVSVSLIATMPLLVIELVPVGIFIFTVLVIWRAVKYYRKKMNENKHYIFL